MLQALELECDEAKIEDNDYTVHSYEDLVFEAQLVQECMSFGRQAGCCKHTNEAPSSAALAKKASFVENQVCFPFGPGPSALADRNGPTLQMVARKQTNLTPAQLEEFESVFRHFDENSSNTLDLNEFGAALSALGFNYADAETEDIHARLSDEEGAVSFEAYLKFLVCFVSAYDD